MTWSDYFRVLGESEPMPESVKKFITSDEVKMVLAILVAFAGASAYMLQQVGTIDSRIDEIDRRLITFTNTQMIELRNYHDTFVPQVQQLHDWRLVVGAQLADVSAIRERTDIAIHVAEQHGGELQLIREDLASLRKEIVEQFADDRFRRSEAMALFNAITLRLEMLENPGGR